MGLTSLPRFVSKGCVEGRNYSCTAVCLERCTKISPGSKHPVCCSGGRSRGNGEDEGVICSPGSTSHIRLGSVCPGLANKLVGAFGCGFVSLSFGLSFRLNKCSCSNTVCTLRSSNCATRCGGDARLHHH